MGGRVETISSQTEVHFRADINADITAIRRHNRHELGREGTRPAAEFEHGLRSTEISALK